MLQSNSGNDNDDYYDDNVKFIHGEDLWRENDGKILIFDSKDGNKW